MAQTFGNTWWGKHWLKSLSNIDYSNRLPRGASYARKGSVKLISISGNRISAKVAGSRRTPYKIEITVPLFSEKQVQSLIDEIVKKPALISKLLNRVLDPEILSIAERLNLKVFPSEWRDLYMDCNCPDWAVPCKHIAAVIYTISKEIDNNPFLIFEMHGADILSELKKREIICDEENQTEVPKLKDLYIRKRPKDVRYALKEFSKIDFSNLQNMTESINKILPSSPAFCGNGDFKIRYTSKLTSIVKMFKRILDKGVEANALLHSTIGLGVIDFESELRLSIDVNGNYSLLNVFTSNSVLNNDYKSLHISELIGCLLKIDIDKFDEYHTSVKLLHQSLYFAIHLIANGAIIPQIYQNEDNTNSVRWTPAYIDFHVKSIVAQFDTIFHDNMLDIKLPNRKTSINIVNQAEFIISYFITQLINISAKDTMLTDYYLDMFFGGVRHKFDGVGEKEIAASVKSWLDHYMTDYGKWRIVFAVTECDENNRFSVEIAAQERDGAFAEHILLSKILKQNKYQKERFTILKNLSRFSSIIPQLDKYINKGAEDAIYYNLNDFGEFLLKITPLLRLLDVKVLLPKSLNELIRPKASVSVSKKSNESNAFLRLDDLLSFNWQVALGDNVVSVSEFKKLLGRASGLIKFKGQYIYVDENDLQKLSKSLTEEAKLSNGVLLQIALTEEYDSAPVTLTAEAKALITELNSEEPIPLPENINATLRPYQERGFSWMYRNMRIGFGSIIADDMGLGKTLQVITLIQKLKEEGALSKKERVIVVAPTGLLFNWEKELERFAPELTHFIYHGYNRKLEDFNADILLTSYGIIRSDIAILKKKKWLLSIIDEAQNIKNHATAQSKAVRALSAKTHIAISGTPVENNLLEFWSIMEFANKGYLGSSKGFKSEYAQPIQLFNDAKSIERFRKITAPFMLRRLKSDKTIISDLPDKIEINKYAQLVAEQSAVYQKTVEEAMALIEGVEDNDSQSLFRRQGLILQMILALKQICNHPALFLKNGDLTAELSGKVLMLLEIVEAIVNSGEKVLVFTQFKTMGDMLQKFIEEKIGIKPLFYHGGSTVKQRQEMIERFQDNRSDKVFILSLKAAGTGLNLTAASHVIHFDLWWNPAVEAQATDRAYRIGQDKNVVVHRFITKDTFEEKINEMIERKRYLADMTITTGENWIGKLTNDELHEIFG